MKNSNRVIFNTFVLYVRLLVTIVMGLLSTRWILQALGESDFGIYNLIAGIVAMLSFLNNAMSNSTQRFLSFAIGKNDNELLAKTFNYSVLIFSVLAIFLVLIILIGGFLLINNVLDIPEERIYAAEVVLISLSVGIALSVLSSPYGALLSAHEKMVVFAFVNIVQSSLKLIIAFFLLYYSHDRLLLYSYLSILVSFAFYLITYLYCWRKFPEVKFKVKKVEDRKLLFQLCSFSGYKFLAIGSNIFRMQCFAILLNTFGGLVINAAYGIALQVNGQTAAFSNVILNAIRPQIVKSEGMGKRDRTIKLSLISCKFSFLLMSVLIIPLFVKMPYIMEIWLHKVPDYTVLFCRIILLFTLMQQFFIGLNDAIEGVGNVKLQQTVTMVFHLLSVLAAFILLKIGLSCQSILFVIVLEELLLGVIISYICNIQTGLDLKYFYFSLFLPLSVLIMSIIYICLLISSNIENDFYSLIFVTIIDAILLLCFYWFFLFSKYEKDILKAATKSVIFKIQSKR